MGARDDDAIQRWVDSNVNQIAASGNQYRACHLSGKPIDRSVKVIRFDLKIGDRLTVSNRAIDAYDISGYWCKLHPNREHISRYIRKSIPGKPFEDMISITDIDKEAETANFYGWLEVTDLEQQNKASYAAEVYKCCSKFMDQYIAEMSKAYVKIKNEIGEN